MEGTSIPTTNQRQWQPKAIVYFVCTKSQYKNNFYCLLDEIVDQATDAKKQSTRKQIQRLKQQGINVSTLFSALRLLNKLAYKVVKASDIKSKKTESIEFIKDTGGECLLLPTRQQIVVYPESSNMINHINWVYP